VNHSVYSFRKRHFVISLFTVRNSTYANFITYFQKNITFKNVQFCFVNVKKYDLVNGTKNRKDNVFYSLNNDIAFD